MNKLILPDYQAFEKVSDGLNKIANAVKSTLGPKGQNVMIQHEDGRVSVTKDGVTVAGIVSFKDPLENIGAQLIKDVAQKTVESSGDGTTSASVLTQAIFNEGRKMIAAKANPMELKKGIDMAVSEVVKYLKNNSVKIVNNDQIKTVATVASNNDEAIGALIADAMDKVGEHGAIRIGESQNSETQVKVLEGMQFERGWQSSHFITDYSKNEAVLENPYILIYDKKIKSINEILPILGQLQKEKESILIISDDVEDEAFATIVMNKLQHGLKICAVKAPAFGEWRKLELEDIATVTGGTLISEELGMKLITAMEEKGFTILGRAERVIVTRDRTVIVNGHGEEKKIKALADSLKEMLEGELSEFYRKHTVTRLAKLTGGVAMINVGAATEIAMNEIKDRIDDALQATRAAKEEGIIPGGGITILRAIESLNELEGDNFDQNVGINIIKEVLKAPLTTILNNAGLKTDVIIDNIEKNKTKDYGYNAKTDKYEHFNETGIQDPVKVVRLCLENAASVAGMLLTSKTLIYNDLNISLSPIE